MKTKHHIFNTFPEFSRLSLSDKDRYQSLIRNFPPYIDFSFPSLMTWWSSLRTCNVSQLNGNLVIEYWLPGFEEYSGLSVIGIHDVDETVAVVIDYLRQSGAAARLVHVPEFTVSRMRYPELYDFITERDYDEYVVPVANLKAVGSMIVNKRWRVRRFLSSVGEDRVSVDRLDLRVAENQNLLLNACLEWKTKGGLNNVCKLDNDLLPIVIQNAEALGLDNVCVFIDGKLHSFIVYQASVDAEYIMVHYARFSYEIPHIFEFAAYKYAQWFDSLGIKYANLENDMGMPILRTTKLALGPTNFFRKYSMSPALSVQTTK